MHKLNHCSVMMLREYGLMDKWRKDFSPKIPQQCQKSRSVNSDGFDPLTMERMKSIFISLFIGYGIALIAFIFQIIIFRFKLN